MDTDDAIVAARRNEYPSNSNNNIGTCNTLLILEKMKSLFNLYDYIFNSKIIM